MPTLSFLAKLQSSPTLVRAFPYCLVVVLTAFQGKFGPASAFWIYAVKVVAGLAAVLVLRPLLPEMRWRFSWEAVVAGVGVFAIWVGLDSFYPKMFARGAGWNPFAQFPENETLAWCYAVSRIVATALVVPPIEEVFYRSLVYRSIAHPQFTTVPVGAFSWTQFLVTSVLFGMVHAEWLAGILCGLAYQGLVCHKKRLGDAMAAHAITNALLGIWVVWKGAWHFW